MGKKKGAGRAKQAQKAKKLSSPGGPGPGGKARSAASKKFFPNDGQFCPATASTAPLVGTRGFAY